VSGVRIRPGITGVDDQGLRLRALDDRALDVCFDGRRVWTFWTLRDTEGTGPLRRVAWPRPLVKHLDGRSLVAVRDSATGATYFEKELSLGSGEGRVQVRSPKGVELGFDKSGKLVPTFAGRSEGDLDSLLDATEAVIAALRECGLEPFLAYGTLLGAVREGRVLGHDSDADLGYVSRHDSPARVALESFRVQRELAEQGFATYRYSGGAFRVDVQEGGVTRGLDVFGGFLDRGRLYLMGEVGTPFREEWLRPLATAQLSGRAMPVPAQPEHLLEAMYGPGWKVPDPAFKFSTPARTTRALEGWFRGTQPGIRAWERRASGVTRGSFREPSVLARRAARLAGELGAEVLDVGAGRGADSVWLARQGVAVTAYDYVPRALRDAAEVAQGEGLPLQVRTLNLTEWRSVLAEGTLLAHTPRPRIVIARHVLDATSAFGRESLARLCSMALRDGGRLLADLHVVEGDDEDGPGDPDEDAPDWMVGRPDPEVLATLLRRYGATTVSIKRLPSRDRATVRMVGEWSAWT
jgi:SAM-dependent methyltransferase